VYSDKKDDTSTGRAWYWPGIRSCPFAEMVKLLVTEEMLYISLYFY